MVVVGSSYDFTGAFEEIFVVQKNKNLPSAVADHPDMNVCIIDETAFIFQNSSLENILFEMGYNVVQISEKEKDKYPFDVPLNCLAVGDFVLINPKTVSKSILEYAEEKNKHIIICNQGYAKCSTLCIDENNFITSDKGIAKALENSNKNVLLIREGYIAIQDYNYGFIGGCAGVVEGILVFCGDILKHPDFEKINMFLASNNVEFKCLPGKLTDVGGILEIKDLNSKDQLRYI